MDHAQVVPTVLEGAWSFTSRSMVSTRYESFTLILHYFNWRIFIVLRSYGSDLERSKVTPKVAGTREASQLQIARPK
jgi:hypothetical protein